jgi:hypothetical protein
MMGGTATATVIAARVTPMPIDFFTTYLPGAP